MLLRAAAPQIQPSVHHTLRKFKRNSAFNSLPLAVFDCSAMRISAATAPLQQRQQSLLRLPVKRHSLATSDEDNRKSAAAAKRIAIPCSDDDEPLVASPLQMVSEVFSTAGTASEISDCDASEALGFGEASEADALDIDDGISMQDVNATAAVLPPRSLRDVCVMTLLFRLCSRSMFRTKCRCVSRRWSSSAPSSLAPRAAPNLAASTSAVHPAQAKLHA
jgi:hypothetical protein